MGGLTLWEEGKRGGLVEGIEEGWEEGMEGRQKGELWLACKMNQK